MAKKKELTKMTCCKDAALHIDIVRKYYVRCACGEICTEKHNSIAKAVKEWEKLTKRK